MDKKQLLPSLVYMLVVQGGLLVGSRAQDMVHGREGSDSDWDVMIPFDRWRDIFPMIPSGATQTRSGARRFSGYSDNGKYEVDVWPGDMLTYLRSCRSKSGEPVVVVDYLYSRVYTARTENFFEQN